MSYKSWKIVASVLALLPTGVIAQVFDCSNLDPARAADAQRAFQCVSELSDQISSEKQRVDRLETAILELTERKSNSDHVHQSPVVPANVVVASTKACSELSGGWREYEQARGRVILGANPQGVYGFAKRPIGDIGGEESVQLTAAEMPAHSHNLAFVPEVSNLSGGSYPVMSDTRHNSTSRRNAPTQAQGGSRPHNNVPPYIALYFCKKD
ncbi:MAG: hypothetical protein AAF250_16660 [Pseudomonadota bacterium]